MLPPLSLSASEVRAAKDAALAETVALLVQRKKLNAYGGRRRGHLTLLPERCLLVDWLNEPITAGACLFGSTQEKCWRRPVVLHSGNGAPLKSVTLLTKMYDLGITASRGRPRVSNLEKRR